MNAAAGKKKPHFRHDKIRACSECAGASDVTKATDVGKEMVSDSTPASPTMQHTSAEDLYVLSCTQNWLIFIVQPLFSFSPFFCNLALPALA